MVSLHFKATDNKTKTAQGSQEYAKVIEKLIKKDMHDHTPNQHKKTALGLLHITSIYKHGTSVPQLLLFISKIYYEGHAVQVEPSEPGNKLQCRSLKHKGQRTYTSLLMYSTLSSCCRE